MTSPLTEYNPRADHLNDDEISAYCKLDGREKAFIDSHLVKCAQCREKLPLSGYHNLLGALFEKDIENGRIRNFG